MRNSISHFADEVEWLFSDDPGRQIRNLPAEEMQAAAIQSLWNRDERAGRT